MEVDSDLYMYRRYVNGMMVIDARSTLEQSPNGNELELTPEQSLGPFYPVVDFFSMDNDLTLVDDASAETAVPTVSPLESATSSSTCQVSDKTKCGCDNVNKSDYRGTINTTKDGSECVRWDDDWLSGYFSDEVVQMAGLEENYCRNPVNHTSGPGCYTFIDKYNKKYGTCVIPAWNPCSCEVEYGQPEEEEIDRVEGTGDRTMDVASNDTGEEVDASVLSEPAEEESIGSTGGVEDKMKGDAESANSLA